MKKLIIIVILILGIELQVTAQKEEVYIRLGMTYQEIRKEIPSAKQDKLDSGLKALVQSSDYTVVYYFFNKEDICNLQVYKYHIAMLTIMLKAFNEDPEYLQTGPLEYLYNSQKILRTYTIVLDRSKETLTLYVEDV